MCVCVVRWRALCGLAYGSLHFPVCTVLVYASCFLVTPTLALFAVLILQSGCCARVCAGFIFLS